MGLHYKRVLKDYGCCPTLVCVGATNCGKSISASKALDFLATNCSKILESSKITTSALRSKIFTRQNLPIVVHDPEEVGVLKAISEDTFDGKASINCRETVVPGSCGIVTCNDIYLAEFRVSDG